MCDMFEGLNPLICCPISVSGGKGAQHRKGIRRCMLCVLDLSQQPSPRVKSIEKGTKKNGVLVVVDRSGYRTYCE